MTGEATNGGTISQGDFDTWTFTATQGDYIALSVGTVTQTTAHFAPWIRLVSPTGVLLGNSSTGAATAQIDRKSVVKGKSVDLGGRRIIKNNDGTWSYLLTLANGPGAVVVSTGDEGGLMTSGANAGSIYQGDLDAWSSAAS